MKQERKHRAIELCKDALILLLTGSALWLAAQTQLLAPLNGLLHEDRPQAVTGQVQGSGQTGSAIPLTMVVNLPGGEGMPEGTELPSQRERIRMGIAHDQASCQNLFQQVAGVLVESMSGAGAPEVISREQWEEALTQKLSVYMDFQGELPASVLAAWLSGGDTQLQGNIRCMVLAAEEEAVVLYYRDETDGPDEGPEEERNGKEKNKKSRHMDTYSGCGNRHAVRRAVSAYGSRESFGSALKRRSYGGS